MKHRSDGATALLGMLGFVVGAQLEVDGEIWLHVETTAEVVGSRWRSSSARARAGVASLKASVQRSTP